MPIDIQVKVKEVIRRTHNVKSFRLLLPEAPEFKAGQFMAVTLNNDLKLKRFLSISSSPTEKCYLEFTKKITPSDFSKALDNLKIGDTLSIQYPLGNFVLKAGDRKIAFLSGGIGITPIRSICKYAVDTKLETDIVLIYSNASIRDIAFKEDFDAMEKEYTKLRVAHVLCESEPNFKCAVGLINSTVIKNEIPDYLERRFYLCGPPQMVAAMKKILSVELSIPSDQIVTENFQGY